MTSKRYMSEGTLRMLGDKRKDIEAQIRQIGAEGSGHQRASLHDDAGTENRLNLLRGSLARIGELGNAVIINPRVDCDAIGLGNSVRVQFLDDDSTETFLLLGQDDVIYRSDIKNIISINSPLGGAILGKRAGDEIELSIAKTTVRKIRIEKIDKGVF